MKIIPEYVLPGVTNIVTIYGSSTEEKPILHISNGSLFVETDTQKIYMLDKPNKEWREIQCSHANLAE